MMEMTTKFQSIQEEQNYLPILLVFSLHNQQKKLKGKNVYHVFIFWHLQAEGRGMGKGESTL